MAIMKSLQFLFLTQSLQLNDWSKVRLLYKSNLDFFLEKNISPYFLDKEFILTNPSEAANMIYYLEFLGIGSQIRELVNSFQKYFGQLQPQSADQWADKIYAMTHLVIAASAYYQKFVSLNDMPWVFEYLGKSVGEIIRNTNPDIVAEVGVALKLGNQLSGQVETEIRNYLMSGFDENKGYIPRELNDNLNRAEHRNILAAIVLSKIKKLYPGPNLTNFTLARR